MRWEHECGAPGAPCPHRLAAVDGSLGVTALPYCLRAIGQACPARFTREHVELGAIAGCAVVAGCQLARLRGRRWAEIYDVLPAIRVEEWEVVLSFARDYTARRVPWAVVRRGSVFAMVKLRG